MIVEDGGLDTMNVSCLFWNRELPVNDTGGDSESGACGTVPSGIQQPDVI